MEVKVVIFQIFIVGVFLNGIVAGESNTSRDEEIQIVQQAIQEATVQHDEQIQQAMENGAQSPRREPKKSTEYSREIGRISNIYRSAYQTLISSNKMNGETALKHLKDALPQACQLPTITCDPDAPYRTVNGSCNNLKNPRWGTTGMPNNRVVQYAYGDSTDAPRGGLEGTGLPPPRDVSLLVHTGSGSTFMSNVTHIAAQFGQFLDHDISLTPVDALNCCQNPSQSQNCWRINVKTDDTFYKGRTTCLDFVRSTEYCFPVVSRREQMNIITPYIDGSVVYGSDEEKFNALRKKEGGRLVENSQYPGFLPYRSDVNLPENGVKKTIIAGDVRADEMPGLAVLQALFLREHNRIADEFAKLQSNWTDERIFQETRRIIAAELQQITYSEFLPAVVGHQRMAELQLKLPDSFEEYTNYQDIVDATIISSFSTAAYRFGHTLVNGLIELYLGNNVVDFYNVREHYLNVDKVTATSTNGRTGYHLILNGLIRQRAQAFDAEIHEDMTNYLFADITTMIGHDLAARNIQRGRDHGTPPYNEFRKFCKLPTLTSWSERPREINVNSWAKLQSVYSSPLDIDLYTGGLSEDPSEGALSGPTFICLQAIQFERIMKGDRFFFTHRNQTGSFTTEQLVALRKRTFGDIICQNSDLEETARNVFYVYSNTNPMVSCKHASRQLDISLFANIDGDSAASTCYSTLTVMILSILCSLFSG